MIAEDLRTVEEAKGEPSLDSMCIDFEKSEGLRASQPMQHLKDVKEPTAEQKSAGFIAVMFKSNKHAESSKLVKFTPQKIGFGDETLYNI